jgi:hypothetical protein
MAIDPDGRDFYIFGNSNELNDEALRQLQVRMKDRITLIRNSETGQITYTLNEGQKLKGDAKRMASIIDNNSITVNLHTTDGNATSTNAFMVGGAFMGNTVDTNGNVVANQEVNPQVLGTMSNAHGQPGMDMMHEVTEAYEGALISQQAGVPSLPSNQAGSVYSQAHNKATPQSGVVTQTAYGRFGMIVPPNPLGARSLYSFPVYRVDWSVTNAAGQRTIIQRFP